MFLVAGVASTISVLLGWLVTLRLFALARRTGETPEKLLALAFGSMLCIGYPLAGLSRAPGLSQTHQGSLVFSLGLLAIVIGIASFARFPSLVFRPSQSWATGLSALLALTSLISAMACGAAVTRAGSRAEAVATIQPGALGLMASIGLALAWNAAESFVYSRRMSRRLSIGLADWATTHRFFLWSLASALGALQVVFIMTVRAAGFPILAPLPALTISTVALVTSVCWWVAFFMPPSYRALFEPHVSDENAA